MFSVSGYQYINGVFAWDVVLMANDKYSYIGTETHMVKTATATCQYLYALPLFYLRWMTKNILNSSFFICLCPRHGLRLDRNIADTTKLGLTEGLRFVLHTLLKARMFSLSRILPVDYQTVYHWFYKFRQIVMQKEMTTYQLFCCCYPLAASALLILLVPLLIP